MLHLFPDKPLGLIIAAIIAVVVLVAIRRPWGAGNQGEWFYFSIAVLLALGWAVGTFVRLGRRQRRQELPVRFCSSDEGDIHMRELRFGSSPVDAADGSGATPDDTQFRFSRDFNVPLASLSPDVLPDEGTVRRLEAELANGVDLDAACRIVQPAYCDWNAPARWAYRQYVASLLRQLSAH